MTTLKIVVGTILLTFMISCGQDINPDEILKKETEFKLTIHSKPNTVSDTTAIKTIPKNSEIINKLKDWLRKNPDDWKNLYASVATPDISLTGKTFRFLVYENSIVIGFNDKNGKPRQCSKQVKKIEFNFLIENK